MSCCSDHVRIFFQMETELYRFHTVCNIWQSSFLNELKNLFLATGKLEDICLGLGANAAHVRTIDSLPKNIEQMKNLFREEINYNGLSVIISRRECIQTARRHASAKK